MSAIRRARWLALASSDLDSRVPQRCTESARAVRGEEVRAQERQVVHGAQETHDRSTSATIL